MIFSNANHFKKARPLCSFQHPLQTFLPFDFVGFFFDPNFEFAGKVRKIDGVRIENELGEERDVSEIFQFEGGRKHKTKEEVEGKKNLAENREFGESYTKIGVSHREGAG